MEINKGDNFMTFKSFLAVSALTLTTLAWNSYSAQEISTMNELNRILGMQKPVVVKFSAQWCGPCRQFEPIFNSVSAQQSNVEFVKVDIDRSKDIASKYNVRSIPTTIFFKNGREVGRINGAPSKGEFINKIKSYCGF